MTGLLLRFPVTTLCILGLLLALIVMAANIDYDSGGAMKLVWWAAAALTMPMNFIRDLFFSFTGGESRGWQLPIAILGQIGIGLLIDWALFKIRSG